MKCKTLISNSTNINTSMLSRSAKDTVDACISNEKMDPKDQSDSMLKSQKVDPGDSWIHVPNRYILTDDPHSYGGDKKRVTSTENMETRRPLIHYHGQDVFGRPTLVFNLSDYDAATEGIDFYIDLRFTSCCIAPFIKSDLKDYLIKALEVGRRCIFAVNEKIRESYDAEESTPAYEYLPPNLTSNQIAMSSSPPPLESAQKSIDVYKGSLDRIIDSGSDADSESSSQNSLDSIEGGAATPRSFKSAISSFQSGSTSHYSSRLTMTTASEGTEIPISAASRSSSPLLHEIGLDSIRPESYPWKIPKATSPAFHGKPNTESSVKKFGVYVVQLALILDLKHVGLKNVVSFHFSLVFAVPKNNCSYIF